MAEKLTKADILARIRAGREDLGQAVIGLTDEQMVEPALSNGWSVKDTLAHVTAWEAELVTALMQIAHGQKPQIMNTMARTDEYNAEVYDEQRDRPLERVLADFNGIAPQLLKRVEGFSERDLTDPNRYSWLKGRPLEWVIAVNTYDHYPEHTRAILQWKAIERS